MPDNIYQPTEDDSNSDGNWTPTVGQLCIDTVDKKDFLSVEAKNKTIKDSADILSKCIDPNSTEEQTASTSLIFGYVQSGKTLSFTTVAALANDNNYRMIVVLSGTKNKLDEQTVKRLKEDLAHYHNGDPAWKIFNKDTLNSNSIKNCLSRYDNPDFERTEKRCVLIVIKKNSHSFSKLQTLFDDLGEELLRTTPTLFIDDEADHASLNNKVRQGTLSSTYRAITALKGKLPLHSYLQYTATPQPNLVIPLRDQLSASFCHVLDAGDGYTGGQTFFAEDSPYVQHIPMDQIRDENDDPIEVAPTKLMEALGLFYVGVASHLFRKRARLGNPDKHRSMLVHPTWEIEGHHQYYLWIKRLKKIWEDALRLPDNDRDKVALMEFLRESHVELAKTVDNLPQLEELPLSVAISLTNLIECNTRPDNRVSVNEEIDWGDDDYFILVGGEVFGRGFTVHGLTVTYMPRMQRSTGSMDSIQQRARFFGYKEDYLDYCRIYLAESIHGIFTDYLLYEESLRGSIKIHNSETDGDFKKFQYIAPMPGGVRETRDSVAETPRQYIALSNKWVWPKYVEPDESHAEYRKVIQNNSVIDEFVLTHSGSFNLSDDDRQTPYQKHAIARGILLKEVYEKVIDPYLIFEDKDNVLEGSSELNSLIWNSLKEHIIRILDKEKDKECVIYRMAPTAPSLRERELIENEITALAAGRSVIRTNEPNQYVYPGDSNIRINDPISRPVTLQLHELLLHDNDKDKTTLIPRCIIPHIRCPKNGYDLRRSAGVRQ